MKDELTYDIVWQVYQKEKQTNKLFPLQKDFYSEVEKLAVNKSMNNNGNNIPLVNIHHLIKKIKEKRKQKILLYVAYDKQIDHPIPTEEYNLYNKITKIFTETGTIKPDEHLNQKLNILQDIPEIFLPSGNKIGPLKKSEKIQINNKADEEFLITNMLCEVYTN